MIDEKKIEEAAEEATAIHNERKSKNLDYLSGFMDGVHWFKKCLWHDISKCNYTNFNRDVGVLCIDREGFPDVRMGRDMWVDQNDYAKWLYIDDLME